MTNLQKDNPRTFFIVVGDINRQNISFLETMSFKNVVNFVTFPQSNSILDAVYVRGDYYITKKMAPISTSDHNCVLIIPKYNEKHRKVSKRKSKMERDLSRGNISNMQECINNTDWDMFKESSDNLNEFTEVISSYISFVAEQCVPLKKSEPIEMTKRIPADSTIKQLEKEKLKAIEDGNKTLRNKIQRTINRHVRNVRCNTFRQIQANSNSFWSLVKSIKCPNDSNKPCIDENFGDALNKKFGRFNQSRDSDIIFSIPELTDSVCIPEINLQSVCDQFKSVKRGVACGSDKLPWWVFKLLSNDLAPTFTYIFQETFSNNSIPSLWKNALTTPVPKIKKPLTVNDYRPIDLASIAFNCLQKILLPRLMTCVDNLGDTNQFAYKKGVSCVDAVLVLVNDVVTHLNSKETTMSKVIFLDFSSAFNTVLPNMLLKDLSVFIKEPWFLKWLSQFLHGWKRQIKLDKGLSEQSEIHVGVPQGGPLSAILFTIYTDDMRSDENISVIKYADDTAISCKICKTSVDDDQAEYQSFIDKMVSQCDEKNLLLNPKKSKEICFINKNVKHKDLLKSKLENIIIHDAVVPKCEKTDYLGVRIDEKLSFSFHVSKLLSTCYYIISSLSYVLSFCNFEARFHLFKSVIVPQLVYAVPVWYHFILEKDKERIRKFLKYTSKILHLDFFVLVDTVNNRANCEFVNMVSKINEQNKHPLHNSLHCLLQFTNRNLRNKNIVPKFRIQVYKNSFIYRAALYLQTGRLEPLI